MKRVLRHLPLLFTVLAGGGFFAHAATAGRHHVEVRCERADDEQVVDLALRRDALAYTSLGIVVTPTGERPFVATSCQEVRP
jgi:hypothetical protein